MKNIYFKKWLFLFFLLLGLKVFGQNPPPTITSMSPNILCSYANYQGIVLYGNFSIYNFPLVYFQEIQTQNQSQPIYGSLNTAKTELYIYNNGNYFSSALKYKVIVTEGTLPSTEYTSFTVQEAINPNVLTEGGLDPNYGGVCSGEVTKLFGDFDKSDLEYWDSSDVLFKIESRTNASTTFTAGQGNSYFGLGKNSVGKYYSDIYSFNNGGSINFISTFTPGAREGSIMLDVPNATGKNRLIVGLGNDATTVFSDFYTNDIQDPTKWVKLNNEYPGVARSEAISFVVGTKAYVGLGKDKNGVALDDIYVLDLMTDKWNTTPIKFPDVRYSAFTFTSGSTVFVGGGTKDGVAALNSMYSFNATTSKWLVAAPMPVGLFETVAVVENNGFVHVGTGYTKQGLRTNKIYTYNTLKKSWLTTTHEYIGGEVSGAIGWNSGASMYMAMGRNQEKDLDMLFQFTPLDQYKWYEKGDFSTKPDVLLSTDVVFDSVFTAFTLTFDGTKNGCTYSTDVDIYPSSVDYSISNKSVTICKGDSVVSEVLPSNPQASYTYNWKSSPVQKILSSDSTAKLVSSPTLSTNYIVKITDFYSLCSKTDTVKVQVNPKPVLTVTSTPSSAKICLGDTLKYVSKDNLDSKSLFTWSNTSIQKNGWVVPTIATNGTKVQVVAKNTLGCKDSLTVSYVVNALPTIPAKSVLPICAGDTAKFNVIPTKKLQIYWYKDPKISTSFAVGNLYKEPNVLLDKTVYLSVKDSLTSCFSKRDSLKVLVSSLPVFSVTKQIPICKGDSALIKITDNANDGITYKWTSSDVLKNDALKSFYVKPVVDTKYFVEAIRKYTVNNTTLSCKAKDSVSTTINQVPIITVKTNPTNATVCLGDSIQFTASSNLANTTFTWSNSRVNGFWLKPTASNKLSVVGTSGNCSSSVSTAFTVNALPTITSKSVAAICEGDTAKYTAATNAKSKILWYADNKTTAFLTKGNVYSIPKLTTAKTIYLAANDTVTGCFSKRDSLTPVVNALPTFSVKGNNPTSCGTATGSVVFSGLNNSTSYTYKFNALAYTSASTNTTGSFTVASLKSGSYVNFLVKDGKGCIGSNATQINLVDPNSPVISLDTVTKTYCIGDSILLNATATPTSSVIKWDNNVINNIKFKAPLKETTYKVTADNQGCVSSSSVRVKIKYNQVITFSPIASVQDFAKGSLNLTATAKSELKVVFTSSDESIVRIEGNKAIFLRNGSVVITAIQNGDDCYNAATPVSQTITISGKASQTISVPSSTNIIFGGALIEVPLITSAELPITYIISDTNVVKIVDGYLIVVGNGNATITAFNAGNEDYNSVKVVYTVAGIISPFTILGKKYVKINTVEKYKLSPSFDGISQIWKYSGDGILYATGIESDSVSIYFTENATSGVLTCYVFSNSDTLRKPLEINIPIVINRDRINELSKISCDQLTGHKEACTDSYINDFVFNSIKNPNSGCSQAGFQDNTSSIYTSELYLGESYNADISLGLNLSDKNAITYVAIWIDYNNDGDFSDPDEFVISKNTKEDDLSILNIVIKSNFDYKGDRRMRVRTRTVDEFGSEDWCIESNQKGETEDYKITLVVPDQLSAPVLITPNNDGKNDLFIIKGLSSKENKLTIFNRAGDIVYEVENYKNNWSGTDNNGKKLMVDTYYYYFENNGSASLKGFFEIRY